MMSQDKSPTSKARYLAFRFYNLDVALRSESESEGDSADSNASLKPHYSYVG